MKKLFTYVMSDILRNKVVLIYTAFLLVTSFTMFSLEDNNNKGLLSLLNIILIIVPLVSVVFATIYIYNSAEFIELLVSQPLKRKTIWFSLFAGLSSSLGLSFLVGVGIPVAIYQMNATGVIMVLMGLLLTVIFIALAFLASVKTRDKARGIGSAILLWLYFTLLFDGLVLFLLFQFSDYPIEKSMIAITALNPIDIGRILILLRMDVSAMMGYTGAIFKNFFGTQLGVILSFFILIVWIIVPVWLSGRFFNRKDL